MSLSTHTASGQALGYYFQLERALSWIAQSRMGTVVGMETEDDVVVTLTDGHSIREQDKSSTTSYPFSTRNSDFWKTLNIWLEGIKEKEIDPALTTFYMVTNKASTDSLAREMGLADDDAKAKVCITKLRTEGASIETAIKPIVQKVLAYSDQDLLILVKNIRYKDGAETYSKDNLVSDLQIVEDDPQITERIINELTGWLFNEVVESWRAKQPALVDRDALIRTKNNIISSIRETMINDNIFAITEITAQQELDHQESIFVKQLDLVNASDEEIMEAIHDYLNSISKKTGIATKGYVTHAELEEMESELIKRWKTIFRSMKIVHKTTHSPEDIGHLILLSTLDHNATLGRYKMQNYFLTRGTYHLQADKIQLGWHPDYSILLKQKNEKEMQTEPASEKKK